MHDILYIGGHGMDILIRGVPAEVHLAVKVIAAEEGSSIKDIIIRLMKEYAVSKGKIEPEKVKR
jgi:cysteine synthase